MREFADCTSLSTPRVRNNSVHTIISSNTFKELREFNLCKNNITFLEMNAFTGLVGLKKLLLCQNSILYWNQNLKNVFKLEELDISGNNMRGFKFDMLPKSVMKILADNNNYDCNCQLQDEIRKYLLCSRRQNITGVCSMPTHLRSLQLDTFSLKEPCMNNFTCRKDTSKSYCKCGIEYTGEYCEKII
ncbi:leucine-rich repeat-containing protein 19-like [Hydractinia symbiolongicarpus]|uniref:leucine-rich repeat-containing protein 19-like n=1 Tax=Hydractinia symbiolongicarpus TaxID=13093 RepID=UPI00254F7C33|nr:leucine-rich repeat-containing protein 19-like [Hydractinia symbiolongicarpus]